MQSLKSRFNGNSGEVIKYAREFGVGEAMREYQVKDYVAMDNFLKEVAPGENFQYAKFNSDAYSSPDAFDHFCEAMLRKYSQMETAYNSVVAENAELNKQLTYYKGMKWQRTRPIVEGLLQYCEGK